MASFAHLEPLLDLLVEAVVREAEEGQRLKNKRPLAEQEIGPPVLMHEAGRGVDEGESTEIVR